MGWSLTIQIITGVGTKSNGVVKFIEILMGCTPMHPGAPLCTPMHPGRGSEEGCLEVFQM